MNPVQQQPGQAIAICSARIAFVRECFRPRQPFLFALLEDSRPISPRRVKLPGNHRTPLVPRSQRHRP